MNTHPTHTNSPSRWLRAYVGKSPSLTASLLLAATSVMSVHAAYTIPNSADLLFAVNTDSLPTNGNTGNWSATAPASGVFNILGTPTVDPVGTTPVKWVKNVAFTTGYYNAWTWTTPVAVNGVSAMAVVKPVRTSNLRNWTPVIDILFGEFRLGVRNDTGVVILTRKNTQVNSTYAIPEGQTTVLSTVVQPDGSYEVWANGTSIMTGGALTGGVTSLVNGTRRLVCIGTSQDDRSATFNGNIGDVLMWKIALDSGARSILETDLMAKFHAGTSFLASTITPSVTGTGGTLSPAVATTVPYEADLTFTISKNYGYKVDIVVDGVAQGNLDSYTFNDSIANHTLAANFSALPTRTLSGNVVAKAGGGATISVKQSGSSLPAQQVTTDSSGNFSMTVPEGIYYICASQTGYMISNDTACNATGNQVLNYTLVAKRNLPKMETLLFAADSNDLGAVGTTGNWDPLLYCTYPGITKLTAIATPAVTKVRGIKYDSNVRSESDGYRLNTAIATANIPTSGATVVAVVKPIRIATSDGWNSVVDIFYSNMILGVKNNTGQIQVRRNGTDYWSTSDAAGTLADGQLAILSLVVQPDGQFKVWCSRWNNAINQFGAASVILSSTATSAFTAFVPAQAGPEDFRKWINIGRNNPDPWPTFNGYIGDVFVYKTSLSDADRAVLEADINSKTISIPAYNITASAGANGTISPVGVTSVGETDSQTYTLTPAFGYAVADLVVDAVSQGPLTSYTFNSVTTTHTITASFVAKPTYSVSGTVTRGTDGSPLAGAKVYVSTTANASVSPYYTLTTDAAGNYSVNLFNATWYLCASASGLTTAPDVSVTVAGAAVAGTSFALTASGRNIPRMDQLQFALYGTALTASGTTTNPWPLEHPAGATATVGGSPSVTTVDGVQWEQNRYATAGIYTIGSYPSPIPITGATATAVIQPVRTIDDMNWNSIIDVMYDRLILAINNKTGELIVTRNGIRRNTAVIIPENQKTILSLIVQQTGQYQLFANGIQVINETSTSEMTTFDPTWNGGGVGFWSSITVGRNAPDGWTTYNGQIGAAFLWKTALTQSERIAFESELGTTFGITMPVYHHITASAGAGGSISPVGTVPVLAGTDQVFTITANIGYGIQDVVVDGESMGATGTYTFPAVAGTHTIAATFSAVPQYAVSGTVTDRATGLPLSGATVNFSATPNAFISPYATATTDASGNYTKTLYQGNLYVSASKTGYYNTGDIPVELNGNSTAIDFSLAVSVRHTPVTDQLLLSALTEVLPTTGATGNWSTAVPVGGTLTQINGPLVSMGNGQQWASNSRAAQTGYRLGQFADPIPCSGATVLVVVKPVRNGVSDGWNSVVDLFYDRLVLGVRNDNGLVTVRRSGSITSAAAQAIPDGQTTILSLVVQPDGSYRVFANGLEIPFTNNGTVVGGFTSLVPGVTGGDGGYGTFINVGRNNPDGWTVFNGNIGDVFVYKTALTQDQRMVLEQDAAAKYGITLPVYHTITSSAGANGTISPNGAYKCADGQDQTFTFTPSAGFMVEDVLIDGESYGATPSYTFSAVAAPHTIRVTFVTDPGQDGYGNWISTWFVTGEPAAEKTADPDGDGRNNLLEYALDDEPNSGMPSGKVRSRIEDVDGEMALLITLPVLDSSTNFAGTTAKSNTVGKMVYTIEGTNGLDVFDQVVTEVTPARSEGMVAPYSGWTYRTFRLSGAVPTRGAKGFLRVRVAETP